MYIVILERKKKYCLSKKKYHKVIACLKKIYHKYERALSPN